MSAITFTRQECRSYDPCENGYRDAVKALNGWHKRVTVAELFEAGVAADDILWLIIQASDRRPDVARKARLFAADCVAHVLPLFEKERPNDHRPRKAIQAARDFAEGRIDAAAGAAAGDAARAAAGDAARAAAGDAARNAAGAAAGAAAGNAAGAAAWAAAWAAARNAAGAAAWAAAWAAERQWQNERLTAWFSDAEPEPLALPEMVEA